LISSGKRLRIIHLIKLKGLKKEAAPKNSLNNPKYRQIFRR